ESKTPIMAPRSHDGRAGAIQLSPHATLVLPGFPALAGTGCALAQGWAGPWSDADDFTPRSTCAAACYGRSGRLSRLERPKGARLSVRRQASNIWTAGRAAACRRACPEA